MNSETGIRKNIIGEPCGLPIFGASVLTGFSEKHSKIKDYSAARRSHKKVVATANRRESACKRTGEPSVPFCEKMRQDKRLKNYSAARRNMVPAKPNRFCGMKEEQ